MDFETLRYEVSDGLARLTLDRPEHMNGMTNRMVREAHDALELAAADRRSGCSCSPARARRSVPAPTSSTSRAAAPTSG